MHLLLFLYVYSSIHSLFLRLYATIYNFFVDFVLWYLIADGILGHDFSRRRWVFPVALAALRFARVMKLQLFVTGEEDWASWYIFKP